jgi:hypothetical protein
MSVTREDRQDGLELYRQADDLFSAGRFDEFNELLKSVDILSESTFNLIVWLTNAAMPKRVEGKERLGYRAEFIRLVRAELANRPPDAGRIDRLLRGLCE